jgi:hypothetical protein
VRGERRERGEEGEGRGGDVPAGGCENSGVAQQREVAEGRHDLGLEGAGRTPRVGAVGGQDAHQVWMGQEGVLALGLLLLATPLVHCPQGVCHPHESDESLHHVLHGRDRK